MDKVFDYAREKMNKPLFFINRLKEDLEVLDNLFDIAIVTDVRLPLEFEEIKKVYPDAKKIHVVRPDLVSNLSEEEQKHITETALDNYKDYDYEIINTTLEQLEGEFIMKKMTHNEIRNMWFKFFKSKNHKVIESASLVPINDDTLLWVNAGVTPLKKYFDGTVVPDSKRLTSIQKCIRTNDIENVGVTKRHQTFFEMMGNFSIGDYFKNEAIEFSYELLTSEDWFNIPVEKLYVTIYTDDNDAFEKWK